MKLRQLAKQRLLRLRPWEWTRVIPMRLRAHVAHDLAVQARDLYGVEDVDLVNCGDMLDAIFYGKLK